jgi:LmbE family N-acetylglucosaminyl deacetylase
MARTLLAIVAHPDDEVFMGGTLAKYTAEGHRVVVAWVTRGELGEISDAALGTSDTLGDVREGEARAAAAALGVTETYFLGFRDSGMVGTEGNQDPRTLPQTEPGEATARFVALLREVRPDVVVTHDPTGGYGHPDHIAANRYTLAAFEALGGDQPMRLFYMVNTRSFFVRISEQAKLIDPDASPFEGFDIDQFTIRDEDVTAWVDVAPYLDRKNAAFNVHRTQFGADNLFRRFPEDFTRSLMAREAFVQAIPPAPPGQNQATDLFDLKS